MKILSLHTVCALALGLFLPAIHAADKTAETRFPQVIAFETGAAEFAADDAITITSVRGDRKHIEPGGSYLVEGSYKLKSADTADLALFTTSKGSGNAAPVDEKQHTMITKGAGKFALMATMDGDGWLHVSFYVANQSHGGVYFGEKGAENTVLRKKSWSDFGNRMPVPMPDSSVTAGVADPNVFTNEANRAILSFLGGPVPPPAGLDVKYNRTGILEAFNEVAKKAGLRIKALQVDDSEFPFLAYGLLDGRHEFRVLDENLRGISGYVYGGSVVGQTGAGSTYFAINIVPSDQYPRNAATACNRRLMVRLQMLADEALRQVE